MPVRHRQIGMNQDPSAIMAAVALARR